MPRTSLEEAKAELLFLLAASGKIDGVASVYDYDPGLDKIPTAVAVTITTAAIGPDDWTFAIRLMADVRSKPRAIQASFDRIMPAITDMLTDYYGPENWVGPSPHPDAPHVFVAEWLVQCGREDA